MTVLWQGLAILTKGASNMNQGANLSCDNTLITHGIGPSASSGGLPKYSAGC